MHQVSDASEAQRDAAREYLRAVGVEDDYACAEQPCDVCGGSHFAPLVDEVEIGHDRRWKLPVVMCENCGFVMQNPRFEPEFYDAYYRKHYRVNLFGATEPERAFMVDQLRRGERLLQSLESYLPATGRLLDVGCSAGGLMVSFAKRGWEVLGTDPDAGYAEYGARHLKLRIETVGAEDMVLPEGHFDLVVITGSLEHVHDVNRTLELCRRATSEGGLMFIEGRALRGGIALGTFSHTHRRYLTLRSIGLLMRKHGWEPILSTDEPLTGPTRPGGVYVLGRAAEPMSAAAFAAAAREGAAEEMATIRAAVAALPGACS
ncbi:class I SAM-dependent methyltransferase [Trinickia dabaoshanensis]|nr:class I SAM-dependent methyltransferase [Trinickia dabaoshanensis]